MKITIGGQVFQVVKNGGQVTAHDVIAKLPELTEGQVYSALGQLKYRGLIRHERPTA